MKKEEGIIKFSKTTMTCCLILATIFTAYAQSPLLHEGTNFQIAKAQVGASDVFVFVNKQEHPNLTSSLNQYASDLAAEGYNATIVDVDSSTTPQAMRQMLINDPNIVGSVMVGHTPIAFWSWGGNSMPTPTDYYFMNLQGTWTADSNGAFYNITGNLQPQIWCGRIKAVGPNTTDLINNYFAKDHKLRTGQLSLPQRALIYESSDFVGPYYANQTYLTPYYDNVTSVCETNNDPRTTNATDFKNKLTLGYEYVRLVCHGAPGDCTFNINTNYSSTVTGQDINNTDPKSFMIDFYTCESNMHTEFANRPNVDYTNPVNDPPCYLAGSWIFAPTYGMLAIGDTGSNGFDYDQQPYFYNQFFGNGTTAGEALMAFQNAACNGIRGRYWPVPTICLIGDPTLKKPTVFVSARNNNDVLTSGDVYVDGSLYAYTNSTIRIWCGNHTIALKDFWRNETNLKTLYRYTFANWSDGYNSSSRTIALYSSLKLTATFGLKYCPGDVDGDGTVSMKDIAIVVAAFNALRTTYPWETSLKWDSRTDVWHDNNINTKDTAYVVSLFNNKYP